MQTTVGIERERFIIGREDGIIVPAIKDLLPVARDLAMRWGLPSELFGYELFAGQIEDRTLPCLSLYELRSALSVNDRILAEAGECTELKFSFTEFVEEDQIPELSVNPFDLRHKKIWDVITPERRLAASRVAATHVHVAVPDVDAAVTLMNFCDKGIIDSLAKVGDHSNGKRLDAYKTMSQSTGIPPRFSDGGELLQYIQGFGGERNVWDFIRYKPSTGTVEFRMFGTTSSIHEVIFYAQKCLELFDLCR